MPLLDQETQVRNSDVYDDTVAAGSGLEAPAVANQNVLFDLNAVRSQVRRIIDPQGLAGTADWFIDIAAALNNFGLRQIHDKKFAFRSPITPGTNDFTLGAPASGVLLDAAKLVSGAGVIAVGPSSNTDSGLIAADESNFTVAGTLGLGLSSAVSAAGVLLSKVDITDAATNDPPLDGGSVVFGLLQAVSGTADGTAVAAAASENLQIAFVKIDPVTDNTVSVSLPAASYHFGLAIQDSFNSLDRGAILASAGSLPDIIDPGASVVRLPFRHFDVTIAGGAAASDPLHIQTGVFTTAGATTVFSTFGTPVLPATAAQFRDDNRVKIWRNGNLQSKGAGKDVQFVSVTQVAFTKKVKQNDEIVIESLSSF